MSDQKGLAQRWEEFRPTKGLWLWSCVGFVIATMVVGFTFGGWVTAGTAQEMVENATEETRAQLVASVCVEKFVNSDQFSDRLTVLKAADSWDRDNLIEDGGWVQLVGMDEPVSDAADLCAERLAEMEVPEEAPIAATPAADVTTPGAPAAGEGASTTG